MGLFDRTTARYGRTRAKAPAGQTVVGAAGGGGLAADIALGQPAPTTRELRAQAVHRLQVGLFGLAAMLLLVSLANVIMDRAEQADRATIVDASAPSASASASAANDPLVDLGVAPELPVGADAPQQHPARPAGTKH